MKDPFNTTWTRYLLAAWVLLTLLFTALSPSASADLSLSLRLLFWMVHVGVPLLLLQAAQMLVTRFAPPLSDWASIGLSGLLGALAFVPVAWALDAIFPDDDDGAEPWLNALLSETMSTVLPVMLVWVALNAPRLLRIAERNEAVDGRSQDQVPVFWVKVPREIGRDLVSLSAELHYLRVRTSGGDALILYPFGKAVEELAALPGQQVHRSHWVALAHIKDITPRGDGATVHLTSETSLPVSRKYRKALSDAWQTTTATGAEKPSLVHNALL